MICYQYLYRTILTTAVLFLFVLNRDNYVCLHFTDYQTYIVLGGTRAKGELGNQVV